MIPNTISIDKEPGNCIVKLRLVGPGLGTQVWLVESTGPILMAKQFYLPS